MTYTKINTLWSLEDIQDRYVFCHEDKQVYNVETNHKLKIRVDKQGYCTVSLSSNVKKVKTVKYHKIIALALINNGPYELIEHIDDDPLNNDVTNLKFSNKRDNMLSAFKNNKVPTEPSKFEIKMKDGSTYVGTMKEISKESGIALGTLYDHLDYPDKVVTNRTKYHFEYIKEIYVGTERHHKHYKRLGLVE